MRALNFLIVLEFTIFIFSTQTYFFGESLDINYFCKDNKQFYYASEQYNTLDMNKNENQCFQNLFTNLTDAKRICMEKCNSSSRIYIKIDFIPKDHEKNCSQNFEDKILHVINNSVEIQMQKNTFIAMDLLRNLFCEKNIDKILENVINEENYDEEYDDVGYTTENSLKVQLNNTEENSFRMLKRNHHMFVITFLFVIVFVLLILIFIEIFKLIFRYQFNCPNLC